MAEAQVVAPGIDDVERSLAPGPLDELHVAERPLVTQVGELVLGAGRVHQRAGVGQQRARLAEQVEADVAEGDVLKALENL